MRNPATLGSAFASVAHLIFCFVRDRLRALRIWRRIIARNFSPLANETKKNVSFLGIDLLMMVLSATSCSKNKDAQIETASKTETKFAKKTRLMQRQIPEAVSVMI